MAPRTLGPDAIRRMGDKLRETRERLDWSRAKLAKQIGTSTTNVHRMESGERGGISMAMLFALVEAMNCSWRDVLGPEPGSDGDHSVEWEAGFRAGMSEAHAAISERRSRLTE